MNPSIPTNSTKALTDFITDGSYKPAVDRLAEITKSLDEANSQVAVLKTQLAESRKLTAKQAVSISELDARVSILKRNRDEMEDAFVQECRRAADYEREMLSRPPRELYDALHNEMDNQLRHQLLLDTEIARLTLENEQQAEALKQAAKRSRKFEDNELRSYQKALELNPNQFEIEKRLAYRFKAIGSEFHAIQHGKSSLKLNPDQPELAIFVIKLEHEYKKKLSRINA